MTQPAVGVPQTPTQRVSQQQAAVNALATFLDAQLTADVAVYPYWVEPDVKLAPKAVTITMVGKRDAVDVSQAVSVVGRTNIGDTSAQVAYRVGTFEQTVQLDVWATSHVLRDDVLAQLDDVLTLGLAVTLGIPSDPVRDGVLLPLDPADGYAGTVECIIDSPMLNDTADAAQRKEYRATFFGVLRGDFTAVRTVPRMRHITDKQRVTEATPANATGPFQTTTLSVNPNPPPAVTVTRGTST